MLPRLISNSWTQATLPPHKVHASIPDFLRFLEGKDPFSLLYLFQTLLQFSLVLSKRKNDLWPFLLLLMSVEPLEELPGATYKGPALPCRPNCDIPSPFYPTAVSFRLSSSAAVQSTHNLVLPCQIRCRTNVLTSSLT